MGAPFRFGYSLYRALRRLLLGAEKSKREKRVCARCLLPIKRNHHWSAIAWTDDQRPRHWDCANPTGALPPPISTDTVGTFGAE